LPVTAPMCATNRSFGWAVQVRDAIRKLNNLDEFNIKRRYCIQKRLACRDGQLN